LPHSTLKRSLLNGRAVGQPGPTGEYLDIYKNRLSTRWNKTCPLHQPLRRQVSKPADSRVSPRAASHQNELQARTQTTLKPVVPECWTSASVPHARPLWSANSSTPMASTPKFWPRWRPAYPRTQRATSSPTRKNRMWCTVHQAYLAEKMLEMNPAEANGGQGLPGLAGELRRGQSGGPQVLSKL
jgi:hypothetical protein